MANMEQIESELRQYIEDAQNLSRGDRFTHLMAIFKKHFEMEKTEHQLTMGDFHDIVSYAKSQYVHTTLPMRISKREIYPSEVANVLMIEAVIAHLNKFKILKRLVKIDYTK